MDNISLQEFAQRVVEELPDYLLQYDIEEIRTETVTKNNGNKQLGLAILLKGKDIAPNIYMDYYYNLYNKGVDMSDILGAIRDEYNKAIATMDEMDFNNVLTNKSVIFMKVVNYERNKEQLINCPYIPMQDLAITFRYLVSKDEDGVASALIRYADLERLDMTKSELYEVAMKNTPEMFPSRLCKITEIMGDLGFDEEMPDAGLYVLTNEVGINGATSMLYDGALEEARKQIGDFYILPSSIHEVLLLKKVNGTESRLEELQSMVKEINEFVVSEQNYLSDSVYEYNEKTKEITMCNDMEQNRDLEM